MTARVRICGRLSVPCFQRLAQEESGQDPSTALVDDFELLGEGSNLAGQVDRRGTEPDDDDLLPLEPRRRAIVVAVKHLALERVPAVQVGNPGFAAQPAPTYDRVEQQSILALSFLHVVVVVVVTDLDLPVSQPPSLVGAHPTTAARNRTCLSSSECAAYSLMYRRWSSWE